MLNSAIVCLIVVVAQIITSVLSAYAFAFLKFPGRMIVFSIFLATLLVPAEAIYVTNFRTIQSLNNLNIQSAMKSGADVLGKFYEVFLRYGNGAKEIGIVLPRRST